MIRVQSKLLPALAVAGLIAATTTAQLRGPGLLLPENATGKVASEFARMGEHAEALELGEEALATAHGGGDGLQARLLRNTLSKSLTAQGSYGEALELATKALASALHGLERYGEALASWERAYAGLRATCKAANRPEIAARWEERLARGR